LADIGTDQEYGKDRRWLSNYFGEERNEVEELTLRIWAAEADYPLSSFCEDEFC
jgi:hypothetical protein